jgi:hypothetical protein
VSNINYSECFTYNFEFTLRYDAGATFHIKNRVMLHFHSPLRDKFYRSDPCNAIRGMTQNGILQRRDEFSHVDKYLVQTYFALNENILKECSSEFNCVSKRAKRVDSAKKERDMQRLQKEQEDAQLAEESKKKRQENAKSRTTALQDDNVRLQLEIQRLKQSMAENTKNNEKQLRDAKNAAKIVANKSKPSVQNKKRARAVSVQEESESESSANDESDEEEIVERSAKAKRGKNSRQSHQVGKHNTARGEVTTSSKPSAKKTKRARAVSVQAKKQVRESDSSANDESDEEEIVERSAKAKRGKNSRQSHQVGKHNTARGEVTATSSKPSAKKTKRARVVSVQEESESESSANDESDEEEIVERSAKAKRGKNHRPRSFDDRQVTVREAKRIALSAVDRQRLLAYEKQDINAFVMNSFDNYF